MPRGYTETGCSTLGVKTLNMKDKQEKRGTEQEQEEQTQFEGQEDMQADELAADISAMQGELETLQQDAAKTHDLYVRTLADFDNFRKRQRDETARLSSVAREDLLLKILPIMDNFQRSLQAAEAQHSYEALVEGVSLTLKQMRDMLEREGVKPIVATGEEFNPEVHEAMMCVETDEYPDNTIIDELETGYTINGKVLRPSRVRVAKCS